MTTEIWLLYAGLVPLIGLIMWYALRRTLRGDQAKIRQVLQKEGAEVIKIAPYDLATPVTFSDLATGLLFHGASNRSRAYAVIFRSNTGHLMAGVCTTASFRPVHWIERIAHAPEAEH